MAGLQITETGSNSSDSTLQRAVLSSRHAGDVYIKGVHRMACCHEEPAVGTAAKAEIGTSFGQSDATYWSSIRGKDHHSVQFGITHAPTAPEITVHIQAESIWRARTCID